MNLALRKPLECFGWGNYIIIFVFWIIAFVAMWRFQVKLEIKVTVINQAKKKGGRLDEGGYYKNEVFLEIFEMLNQ